MNEYGSSDSPNAVNQFIDDPNDGTVFTHDPAVLAILKAEHERKTRSETIAREGRSNGQSPNK